MKILKKIVFPILFVILVASIALFALAFTLDKLELVSKDEFLEVFKSTFQKDDLEEEPQIQIDTTPLELSFNPLKREILESQTAITLYTNKPIELDASDRFVLFLVEDNSQDVLSGNKKYTYVVEANKIGTGESSLKFKVVDPSNPGGETAIQEIEILVDRKAYGLPFGADKIDDWEGSSYVVADSADLLTLIDKSHKLVDDYDAGELVNVSSDLLLYANTSDLMIRVDAGSALKQMVLDAQNQTGKTLTILSAYRSFNNQVQTYSANISSYGQLEADKISARPGFSEHQLATTVDFYSPDTGSDYFSKSFLETNAGKWLVENSYKYGFVLTLPENQDQYSFEPWHWRYIGIENAKSFHESGMTFNEWLKSL